MFGKGLLGVAAFAALAIGAEREADACGNHNPVPPCGVKTDLPNQTIIVSLPGTGIATPVSATTACTTCGGNLPANTTLVATTIVDPTATSRDNGAGFCGSGQDPRVDEAFTATVGGTWQGGTLFALARSIQGGATQYYVSKYRTDSDSIEGELGIAEVQNVGGGLTINPAHLGIAAFNTNRCTPCTDENTDLAECKAIADASFGGGPGVPTLVQKTLCAVTDTASFLGLEMESTTSEEGGCSTARGGASALLLAFVGLLVGIRRRRRG